LKFRHLGHSQISLIFDNSLHGENIRLESVFGMGLYFSCTIAQNFIQEFTT